MNAPLIAPAPVEIYTTRSCGYCHAAKELLRSKNVAYLEFDVTNDPPQREEMTRRANGRTTVPQIFVGDTHVGGCDDLYALDNEGRLDSLLATGMVT
ncbi:MAG: glutaredoxin 3 [Xanthobacteraceae bacterium]|nr:MAG: glutaredoxin 3 [Xanthobacteraceae bacterium]